MNDVVQKIENLFKSFCRECGFLFHHETQLTETEAAKPCPQCNNPGNYQTTEPLIRPVPDSAKTPEPVAVQPKPVHDEVTQEPERGTDHVEHNQDSAGNVVG